MKIIERLSVNNDCYKNNVNKVDSRYTNFQKNGPQGLMLHSVGCPQSSASVFANLWNQSNYEVAVHAALQEDGTVYQCLPWNYRGWHSGGSSNNTHIGVEMTEPDCIRYVGGATFRCSNLAEAREQVKGTYKTAVELFAFLCKKYNLDPMKDGVIISHAEGYSRGVASGHADPEHLWDQLNMGYTMNGFRKDVKAAMGSASSTVTPSTPTQTPASTVYRIRKSWNDAKSQVGAYANLNNAKAACDKAGNGYFVFDESGKVVYPVVAVDTKIDTVKEVQKWLNDSYAAGLVVDGIYGPKTQEALIEVLQKSLGVTADGIYGPQTNAAVKTLKIGSSGLAVKALQGLLVCNGYTKAYVDGDYGDDTYDAVVAYQSKKNLSPDGEAGKMTFSALCK